MVLPHPDCSLLTHLNCAFFCCRDATPRLLAVFVPFSFHQMKDLYRRSVEWRMLVTETVHLVCGFVRT